MVSVFILHSGFYHVSFLLYKFLLFPFHLPLGDGQKWRHSNFRIFDPQVIFHFRTCKIMNIILAGIIFPTNMMLFLMPLKTKCHILKNKWCYKINSFNDKHNHSLTLMIQEIALWFCKLTPKMLVDIEKYVIQGLMDVASIWKKGPNWHFIYFEINEESLVL